MFYILHYVPIFLCYPYGKITFLTRLFIDMDRGFQSKLLNHQSLCSQWWWLLHDWWLLFMLIWLLDSSCSDSYIYIFIYIPHSQTSLMVTPCYSQFSWAMNPPTILAANFGHTSWQRSLCESKNVETCHFTAPLCRRPWHRTHLRNVDLLEVLVQHHFQTYRVWQALVMRLEPLVVKLPLNCNRKSHESSHFLRPHVIFRPATSLPVGWPEVEGPNIHFHQSWEWQYQRLSCFSSKLSKKRT